MTILQSLTLPVVIVAFLCAAVQIINWNWRVSVGCLIAQYACVFILVSVSWPVEPALVKLVAGWIACLVLGLALFNLPAASTQTERFPASEILFRIIVSILAGMFAFTSGSKIVYWFPEISLEQAYGCMILITLGLVHLGLTMQPYRVVIGLLTVLSGFGIIYAAVESSVLITGLLAIITLGLAILGSYLLTAPTMEEAS